VNKRLAALSIFLDNHELHHEAGLICKISQDLFDQDEMNKEVSKMLSGLSGQQNNAPPELNQTQQAELQKWSTLLDSIDKPFNYEITMENISKELKQASEIIRGKADIPENKKEVRQEVIEMLRGGRQENSVKDILSDDQSLLRLDDKVLRTAISQSLEAAYSELPKKDAFEIIEMKKGASISKEAFLSKLTKALPYVGVLISLPLFAKNLRESYMNSKKIIDSLPLKKYGISPVEAMSPTFIANGFSKIQTAISQNSKYPDNLLEILEIISVVKAFQLDVVFTITNGIALFLDALQWVALIAPEAIASKITSGVFAVADLIIQLFFLMGTEIATEYASDAYWSPLKESIKEIAKANVNRLSGRALAA